jgi:hypothetical protein
VYTATNGERVFAWVNWFPGEAAMLPLPPTRGHEWLPGRRLGEVNPPELPAVAVGRLLGTKNSIAATLAQDTRPECIAAPVPAPEPEIPSPDALSEAEATTRKLSPQERIAAWQSSEFLKVNKDWYGDVGNAAFTLAIMMHEGRKGVF